MQTVDDVMRALRVGLHGMRHNRLINYIVPGLMSELVGGAEFGKVRLFTTERAARDFVTPHSHRFNFTAIVLEGAVKNTIFTPGTLTGSDDQWCGSSIGQVCGADGILQYVHVRDEKPDWWAQETTRYELGETYSMEAEEIHSIEFARNTRVLFFEGPPILPGSRMLEPWVNGKVVPTFKTEDWMFEHEVTRP